MYTDEQIAEALERCAFESPLSSCEKCPLFDDCADLEKIAAERIRFLKSEIEILKSNLSTNSNAFLKSGASIAESTPSRSESNSNNLSTKWGCFTNE